MVSGTVQSVTPYGAFVTLRPGLRALLHISQISMERFKDADQVFKPGDEVRALAVTVDQEMGRVSLRTRQLEEEPGEMLRVSQRVFDEAEGRVERRVQRIAAVDALESAYTYSFAE